MSDRKPRCRICGTTVWNPAPRITQAEIDWMRRNPPTDGYGNVPDPLPTRRFFMVYTDWICTNGHTPTVDQAAKLGTPPDGSPDEIAPMPGWMR